MARSLLRRSADQVDGFAGTWVEYRQNFQFDARKWGINADDIEMIGRGMLIDWVVEKERDEESQV